MRKTALALVALLILAGACSKEGPSREAQREQVKLAGKPVELSQEAAKLAELVEAAPAEQSEDFMYISATLKAKAELPWSDVFVYAEVMEGAERNLGNTCEQRVAGPIAAGGTFKIRMQVSRYGSGGQRVLLIQRISNESVAP